MRLYHAPLEGIGGYIYRNAQAGTFPKADKYFSPFISPDMHCGMNNKERRDVLPENNEGICLVPQILANNGDNFMRSVRELWRLGYEEVNLNLGCPSKTVVTKKKGSGLLGVPDRLEAFFEQIFDEAQALDVKVSVKTRLGLSDPEEFEPLMELFNRYPMSELIIHPRVQADYYKGKPRMEYFNRALEMAEMPIVYNGDLFNVTQVEAFREAYPQVEALMLGRGILADPCLFGAIRGEESMTMEGFDRYHRRMLEDYAGFLSGEKNVLFKMKEHWHYLAHIFTDHEKYAKKIRKAQRLGEYREVVHRLMAEQEICESTFDGFGK